MMKLLAMFAKLWTPGDVKTRLAAALGPERAAAIQQLFVETLAARFVQTADDRYIVFTPPAAETAFRAVAKDQWRLTPQADGDLGSRMRTFFEAALTQFDRVVLIGSDSPDLPAEFVSNAFVALQSHEVVLGPAQDGGYYLVGAARIAPPIFDEIPWSTARVWPQTIARLRARNCRWHELPAWYDVDEIHDLRALVERLVDTQHREGELARVYHRLQGLLSEGSAE
jgi:rSAM/selenodomain-associated transferase 1